MQHSAKYHIHGEVRADGVVERSDVVGAIFGQTEGLLGDELDLRELQDSSKVGRIDVAIESEGGRSFGSVTIASALDRVETAVLAAALETIERVGPCRAECTITSIEDARAAKRRTVIERATNLLSDVERDELAGERLVEEVRKQARVEEITEYEGLPAGPRVADSDAIIVVEGRADVRQLLEYGIKNAIAVEGTNVPDAVALLSTGRNTTAFLDGDRGGDLILQELQQVGDLDYVAFAPADRSVEDLDRRAITKALRQKVPADQIDDFAGARQAFIDGGRVSERIDESDGAETADVVESEPPQADDTPAAESSVPRTSDPSASTSTADSDSSGDISESLTDDPASGPGVTTTEPDPHSGDNGSDIDGATDRTTKTPATLPDHVRDVVVENSQQIRLLDADFGIIDQGQYENAFETIESSETTPHSVVLDGAVTQRLLDIASQRGIGQLIGASAGEFVKQPTSVRVRIADEFPVQST